MSNVVSLVQPEATEADDVLERAKGLFETAFVVGWDLEGNFEFKTSGNLKRSDAVYLLRLFEHKMLAQEE